MILFIPLENAFRIIDNGLNKIDEKNIMIARHHYLAAVILLSVKREGSKKIPRQKI